MSQKQLQNPADYIEPLYMNGLHGRMLRLKPKPRKNKEILLVYGQHASLERMFSLAEVLNRYGGVTIPDLPGFGGMQSFYKLREKPTIDNMADYLAAFVKLKYKNRRVTIVGVSYGFAVVTRMLQRYPELSKKVDTLISLAGFVHHEDFIFKKSNYFVMRYGSSLFSHKLSAVTAKTLFLRPTFIKSVYKLAAPKPKKPSSKSQQEAEARIAYEIHLWRTNDLRTYMFTTHKMLTFDLCNKQVDLPVYHVAITNDHYINNDIVEQHLNVIYKKVNIYNSKLSNHVPALASDKEVSKLIPMALRKVLSAKP